MIFLTVEEDTTESTSIIPEMRNDMDIIARLMDRRSSTINDNPAK